MTELILDEQEPPLSGGSNPDPDPHKDPGLKAAVLTPLETLAQSIAGIAPSATPGLLIPIVFGFAGNGTWLSYLLATIGILFTAQCINEFARRSACPGSLYTFVVNGLGRRNGILVGWALLFAYTLCGAACATEFAIYASSLAEHFLHVTISEPAMMLLCTLAVSYAAYKNIKMSATLMLRLEILSMSLILLVVALTLSQQGFHPDFKQLCLQDVTFDQVRTGLVMAIFGFTAFESAASLGVEAREPLKTIPQAIMRSVILSGTFFVISSYTMVLSFRSSAVSLDKCSTPLLNMAASMGLPGLGHIIDFGIMLSFFAAGLANLNAAARTLYKMSKNGIFHDRLSNTHAANGTPHVAVLFCSTLSASIAILLTVFSCPLLDIVGWLGTMATFGFIYAYICTTISAAKMLHNAAELNPVKIFIVGTSLSVLVLSLLGSLYPIPDYPYNILPFIFTAYMLAAWRAGIKADIAAREKLLSAAVE